MYIRNVIFIQTVSQRTTSHPVPGILALGHLGHWPGLLEAAMEKKITAKSSPLDLDQPKQDGRPFYRKKEEIQSQLDDNQEE